MNNHYFTISVRVIIIYFQQTSAILDLFKLRQEWILSFKLHWALVNWELLLLHHPQREIYLADRRTANQEKRAFRIIIQTILRLVAFIPFERATAQQILHSEWMKRGVQPALEESSTLSNLRLSEIIWTIAKQNYNQCMILFKTNLARFQACSTFILVSRSVVISLVKDGFPLRSLLDGSRLWSSSIRFIFAWFQSILPKRWSLWQEISYITFIQ